MDLFIPQDAYDAIPAAKKTAFREAINAIKAYATKVGDEMTVTAQWHKCYHDEGISKPCEPWQEI